MRCYWKISKYILLLKLITAINRLGIFMTEHPFFVMYQATKKAILAIAWFSFFINLLMLIVPIYMIQLFDRVIPSFSYDTLIFITLISVVALGVLSALDVVRSHILTRIGHWFEQTIIPITINAIPRQVIVGDTNSLGRLRDCRQLKNFISSASILILFDIPWAPIFLFVIFLLHPALGALSLLGGLVLLILGILNDRAVSNIHIDTMEKSRVAEDQLQITLRHAEAVTAMGMMSTIMDKYFIANEQSLSLQSLVGEKNGFYRSIAKGIRLLLQMLILGLGAYLVLNQSISSGAMLASSILLSKALAPLEQSVASWRQMIEALNAYRRLRAFLQDQEVDKVILKLPQPQGHIQSDKVVVMHANQVDKILDNVQFEIAAGSCLIIMGPSGAGKTTLAKSILGIIKPDTGCVRLDGADVYQWPREDFGRFIGYLPQNISLFKGTVAENIARLKEIDDEKVVNAAKFAGAHDFILRLPKGYQTLINEYGGGLSGGQLQRIGLARAFYGEVKCVVLDEPNANLDEEGMRALFNTLDIAKQLGITVILITHNVSLATKAEKCLILQRGKMVFFDSPTKLIESLKNQDNKVIV